jgi:hypothetical protein
MLKRLLADYSFDKPLISSSDNPVACAIWMKDNPIWGIFPKR